MHEESTNHISINRLRCFANHPLCRTCFSQYVPGPACKWCGWSWWGLVMAEIHPVQWVTLHNIYRWAYFFLREMWFVDCSWIVWWSVNNCSPHCGHTLFSTSMDINFTSKHIDAMKYVANYQCNYTYIYTEWFKKQTSQVYMQYIIMPTPIGNGANKVSRFSAKGKL